ncbi:hypothetical protein [Sandaracinus amylolyticus]|uniref:Uncharacterized protein n=1 Tax=Sandaracinus amylolyticus TaxID=927083 RepID=A0A0F6W900_9BACT|nr:hypothetical protein [Sandaracinus amylolyticus]AKF10525.1 hypothetical protein DB32_007674 [Sandaracinus amylolyticus]
MGDTVELPSGRLEVETRPGYLFIVEHGTLRNVDEVDQYAAALELLVGRTGVRRALIDSRAADAIELPPDVRDALWRWLLTARVFEQIAFVLGSEMAVVRVNMVARSHRAGICAFGAVHEAHRWLSGRQRTLSQTFSAPLGAMSQTPVPPPRAEREPRSSVPPPPPPRTKSDVYPARDASGAPMPQRASSASTGRFTALPPARAPSQPGLEQVRPTRELEPARRKKVEET